MHRTLTLICGPLMACCLFVVPAQAQFRTVVLSSQSATGTAFDFEDFDVPVINSSGRVAFEAFADDGDSSSGIWSEGGGSLAKIAYRGDAAPGTAGVFESFIQTRSQMILNDNGHVVLTGQLDDFDTFGIWSNRSGSLAAIAVDGNPAPGTAVARVFENFSYGSFNNSGQVGFFSSLPPGPAPGNFPSSGIFSEVGGSLNKVAEIGDPAPGVSGGAVFSQFFFPMMNASGQVAFSAQSNLGGGNEGIWSDVSGSLSAVALSGQSAPGGGVFSIQFRPGIFMNEAGDIAFKNTILGGADDGIFVSRNGTIEQVAREGTAAPVSGPPADFLSTSGFGANSPVLDDDGWAAFMATLDDGRVGIWREDSGGLDYVAVAGDLAPGSGGATFLDFQEFAMNGSGMVAFEAGLDTFDEGIWLLDGNDNLVKIVGLGDMIEVAPGDFREVEFAQMRGQSSTAAFGGLNDLGQVAFYASFSDGTTGIFVSDAAAIPEPSSLVLMAVLVAAVAIVRRRTKKRGVSRPWVNRLIAANRYR